MHSFTNICLLCLWNIVIYHLMKRKHSHKNNNRDMSMNMLDKIIIWMQSKLNRNVDGISKAILWHAIMHYRLCITFILFKRNKDVYSILYWVLISFCLYALKLLLFSDVMFKIYSINVYKLLSAHLCQYFHIHKCREVDIDWNYMVYWKINILNG